MRRKTSAPLCGGKKCRYMEMLLMILAMTAATVLCSSCTHGEAMKNAGDGKIEQITVFAKEVIDRDIANYESDPAVNIIESRITRMEVVESFDKLTDRPIEVYALEYRLLPEDPDKIVLAGGMQLDEEGWLKETCSIGSPLLVVANNKDKAELLGILWTVGILEEGGMEKSVQALIGRD